MVDQNSLKMSALSSSLRSWHRRYDDLVQKGERHAGPCFRQSFSVGCLFPVGSLLVPVYAFSSILSFCFWRLSKCPSQRSPVSHAFGWVERRFLEQMKYSASHGSRQRPLKYLVSQSSLPGQLEYLFYLFRSTEKKFWSKCLTSMNHLNLIRQLMDNMMRHCLRILWGQLL